MAPAKRKPAPYGPMPEGSGRQRWARRPADDAEARALASGLRLRILRMTLDEALTNKEIAQRLGRNPASVLHHVRTLLATGFLGPAPERRGARNSREVPYLATGKSIYLEDASSAHSMVDAFVAEVAKVKPEDLGGGRLGLRLSAAEAKRLNSRIDQLLEEYVERDPDPDGDPWSLFIALHPDLSRG